MADNFIGIGDYATVKRLARIIRDGTDAEASRAFDDVTAIHGRAVGIELWDEAIRQVDREQVKRENSGGAE